MPRYTPASTNPRKRGQIWFKTG